MNSQSKMENQESEHVALTYSYTEKYLQFKQDALNDLKNRLTVLLASSGLLLRFALELPHSCRMALLLSIISVVTSAAAGIFCVYGLKARESGLVFKPKDLASPELSSKGEVRLKVKIIKLWIEGIDDITEAAEERKRYLNLAVTMLGLTIIAIALDIALADFIDICA